MGSGGEVPALGRSVGCLSCVAMTREQVLCFHGNRCVREFHLGKSLSNGKLYAVRGRRLLLVGPSCLFSSHPIADCPSVCLLGEGRGTSYLPRKPYLFQELPLTIQRAQQALIFETDAVNGNKHLYISF